MDLIRVGDFELYPSERLLCAAGKPVELGARAFDLLLVLVEHQGRLASKATLIERVWPRLVVDENNLPAQIATLRRVLGAGAIRTVQGFGYRLELPIAAANGSAEPAVAQAPPARTPEPARLAVPRRTWPERLTPLVGREDEVRGVREALARSSLVTIVGIAGVGKTRLAQEILAREADGHSALAWVAVAPLENVGHLPSAIALALGLPLADGGDGFAALCQALENEPTLLILDSVEHLGDGLARPLTALIAQTRRVRVLVTSQAPLGVPGEIVYRLAALPVPAADAPRTDTAAYPAVALFAQRAAAADQRFELTVATAALVAEICRRLDGIPLALELAAARVPALGLSALAERLDDRFRLLKHAGHPADPRHSALHTAFDWSYGLLTPPEQQVFDRLGVFAGSFALRTAAHCVADGSIDPAEAIDLIGRLVDRSLVTAIGADPPRYTLLETARYYARGRLAASGQLEAARGRMAATLLELLDLAYQEYWSLDEAIWLHRYGPELDNVRAALDWATRSDAALGVALYGSAWPLFVEMDLFAEGRARYEQVLTLLSDSLPRSRVGRFWEAIATYDSARQGDRARYAAELAAQMHATGNDTRSRYYALVQLAFNSRAQVAAARTAFDAARSLEDPAWPARLLAHGALTEGALLMGEGEFAAARAAYQRGVRIALTTSERQALAASVNIVELDVARGDTASALQLGRPLAQGLQYAGRAETRIELLALIFSAMLIAGEIGEARTTGAELLELALRLDTGKLYMALDAMALLACAQERHEAAARIAVCADAAHERHGQAQRRPAEERVRATVVARLDEHLGLTWRAHAGSCRERLDETSACALALGLSA